MNQDENTKGPIKALGDGDRAFRQFAAVVLGKIKDSKAVEPLIAALKDADNSVRTKAAEALVKIGQPTVDPLIGSLRDPDDSVSGRAMGALVKIGMPAVDSLIAALKEADDGVRGKAAETLVKIDEPAIEPVIGALQDTDADVRREATAVLARIGGSKAVDTLFQALKEPDGDVPGRPAEPLVIAFIFHNNALFNAPNCPIPVPIASFRRLPVKRVVCLFMQADAN
jgi:HEAT repeat protein